ncbi:MAG TPA: hypothetical protein VFJ43_12375 [Bacteroidia bacterium]|nr:hypothetical protein [Bacteroidia bacterium]
MKTRIPVFPLLFFLFASCNYLPQISKRHYRDGFYIERNNEHSFVLSEKHPVFTEPSIIPVKKIITRKINPELKIIPEKEISPTAKKKTFVKKKISQKLFPPAIVLPKQEPINKKAKAAVILLVVAKLVLGISFLALLLSWLNIFLLLSGAAAFFALLAIAFALWAKKEIGKETGVDKELGEKEAKFVIERAAGGLLVYTFLILLAIVINSIQKARGQ